MGRNDASGGAVSRAGSRDASLFFFGSFIVILIACLCGVYVVHAYWGRQARRLREERRLHEELNNPWAIRERYAAGTGVRSNEGSAKEGSVFGGSVVRGIMYGLYVLNPSGSLSFGASRVETNEKEVKARREAKAEASAAVGGVTNGDGRAVTTDTTRTRLEESSFVVAPSPSRSDDEVRVAVREDQLAAPRHTRAPNAPRVATGVPDPWAPEPTVTRDGPTYDDRSFMTERAPGASERMRRGVDARALLLSDRA
jgi:hypothetical protein